MGRGFSSIGSRKLPASVNRHDALHLNLYASALDEDRTPARKHSMQNLSPGHVKTEESLRLGVVSGPHASIVARLF